MQKKQNIDGLIQGIRTIQENRCSFSDEEIKILGQVETELLQVKNGSESNYNAIVKSIELLLRFFITSSEIAKLTGLF